MMMMNITPQKKQHNDMKQSMKKTGEKVPTKEQPSDNVQVKQKYTSRKKLVCLIIILVLIGCLVGFISYVIVQFSQQNNDDIMIAIKDIMESKLTTGQTFKSSNLQIRSKDHETVDLAINQIQSKQRLLQTSFIQQTLSKIISYYHKNTQISISIDNAFRIQIQIPGDTGLDFVIGNIDNKCLKQLQKLPIQLPITIKEVLEKLTGKKIEVTTCVAYDGVFNNKTNQYTLLNQKKAYHPELFSKIQEKEKDLIGPKPIIDKCMNIVEVSKKITSVLSILITNFKKLIFQNKLTTFIGDVEKKKEKVVQKVKPGEQTKRCTRIGKELLRCCEDSWNYFKVTNLKDSKPLQVWQIIINAQ